MKSINLKKVSKVLLAFLVVFNLIGLSVEASSGDRQTPYSAFTKHTFTLQEYSWDPKRTIEVQLVDILHGDEANQIVNYENYFNEQPGYDEEWIFMKFNMKYVSGPEEELPASDIIYSGESFFTPAGTKISPESASFSENFDGYGQFDVSFYPGSEGTVVYGILVKKSVGGYPFVRIPTSYNSTTGQTNYTWLSTNPNVQEPIDITNIRLTKSAVVLGVGTSETLTTSIQPTNATNKNLQWTSSNSTVAKVVNGTITALKPGTANISVKTSNGKFATTRVTVSPVISAISSDKKSVANKAILNKSVTVHVTNNKITSKSVLKNGKKASWSSSNTFTQDGQYTLTVKDGYGKTNTFTFTIDKKAPLTPSVNKVTSKAVYLSGKAEKGSAVYVYKGSKLLGKGTASSSSSKFKIKIKKQQKGSTLKVYSKDAAGNKSKTKTVKVG